MVQLLPLFMLPVCASDESATYFNSLPFSPLLYFLISFLFLIPRSTVQGEGAANALTSIKPCTSTTSPPHSTTTTIFTYTMSETMVPTDIPTTTSNTEPMQVPRQPDAGSPAPGDTINGYEPQTSTCATDQQYDEKSSPLLIKSGFTLTTRYVVTPASISPTMSSMAEHSPPTEPKRTPSKSGSNVCELCGKSYSRPSTLKAHMRMHSGQTPYRCDTCGKSFIQACNLTVHLRTHSGEKPFSCPICHARFSQSSSVTTHLRTHSGERPYKCDYCDKAFSDVSTLTKHKRIHSSEKPYHCKVCSQGFFQSGNLHRHMKTHNVATQ